MFDKINEITHEVVKGGVELLGDKIDKIVLYGSYARGDYDEESDVDIMFLLDCKDTEISNYRQKLSELSSRIGLDYDIFVSLFLKDKETFYKWLDVLPFYQNVQKDGGSFVWITFSHYVI
ncbi:MAG: nucleotidyltransferase domain-containing protein [Lachnospiraceae bacterium]|nr:nucleotidyltransferase domain-containing protein [Lachnospiraceae bacterium]